MARLMGRRYEESVDQHRLARYLSFDMAYSSCRTGRPRDQSKRKPNRPPVSETSVNRIGGA